LVSWLTIDVWDFLLSSQKNVKKMKELSQWKKHRVKEILSTQQNALTQENLLDMATLTPTELIAKSLGLPLMDKTLLYLLWTLCTQLLIFGMDLMLMETLSSVLRHVT
jgi:hypothetical protein